MEDEKIITLLWERDESALSLTDEKYGSLCKRLSGNILQSTQLAEECVNSVYFKIWKTIPPLKPNSFKAYIITLVKNEALNLLRSEKRHHKADMARELTEFINPQSPESEMEEKEISALVNSFLGTLDDKSRRMFMLRYYYNNPHKVIAGYFGMSENAVKKRLQYIRNRLKEKLIENGYYI